MSNLQQKESSSFLSIDPGGDLTSGSVVDPEIGSRFPSAATEAEFRSSGFHSRVLQTTERAISKLETALSSFVDKIHNIFDKKRESLLAESKVQDTSASQLEKRIKCEEKLEKFCWECEKARTCLWAWDEGTIFAEIEKAAVKNLAEEREYRKERLVELRRIEELRAERIATSEECDELKKKVANARRKAEQCMEETDQLSKMKAECEMELGSARERLEKQRDLIAKYESVIKSSQDTLERLKAKLVPSSGREEEKKSADIIGPIEAARIQEQRVFMESPFAHFYDPKVSTLFIYHFDSRSIFTALGDNPTLPAGHDSVQVGDSIFISGGFNAETMELVKKTEQLEVYSKSMRVTKTQRSDMNLARSKHRLLALDSKTIYCLGGVGSKDNYMNACERFDLQKDHWTVIASMKEMKCYVAAAAFNCAEIYVFGGRNQRGTSNVIERLIPREDKWQTISVKWLPRSEVGCFQISGNEIIIFGGVVDGKEITNTTFIFNVEKKAFVKAGKKMRKSDLFTARCPAKYDSETYCVFGNYDIHMYSVGKEEWKIILANDWQNIMKVMEVDACFDRKGGSDVGKPRVPL